MCKFRRFEYSPSLFNSFLLICTNLKDELNCSYNVGGDAYRLQSIAIHFKHTVCRFNPVFLGGKAPARGSNYLKGSPFDFVWRYMHSIIAVCHKQLKVHTCEKSFGDNAVPSAGALDWGRRGQRSDPSPVLSPIKISNAMQAQRQLSHNRSDWNHKS